MTRLIILFCILSLSPAHLKADDLVHPIYHDLPLEDQMVVFKGAHALAREIRRDPSRLRNRTGFAMGLMVRKGVRELRKKGHHAQADKIEKEWKEQYSLILFQMRDIGDFQPLSDWLSALYIALELLLGENVMKQLHLDDIHILNHAIPVTFLPCKGPWKKSDYVEHFSALLGVVAYWGTWAGCLAGTSGLGSFLCMPAGRGAEFLMRRFLAPPLGRGIFNALCDRARQIMGIAPSGF